MQQGARTLGLELPTSVDEWRERLARLAHANQIDDGSFKVVRFREDDGVGEFAVSRENGYTPSQYARGFRLCTAPAARAGSLHGVKSIAYLENLLAKRAARTAGFDEVIFADSAGNLLEGAGSNLFVVVAGKVCTPPAVDLLPGVARGVVLELGGTNAEERPLTPALVAAAEEVFVTNALMGVMPVSELNGRCFDLVRTPMTQALAAAFAKRQRESVD